MHLGYVPIQHIIALETPVTTRGFAHQTVCYNMAVQIVDLWIAMKYLEEVSYRGYLEKNFKLEKNHFQEVFITTSVPKQQRHPFPQRDRDGENRRRVDPGLQIAFVLSSKGAPINDVHENFRFLDTLPPCHIHDHATYKYRF